MIEETWTWPRYQALQRHWLGWGPPAYIPVAGYFGLGQKGKKGKRGRAPAKPGFPDRPEREEDAGGGTPAVFKDGKGDLRDLLKFFGGGRT